MKGVEKNYSVQEATFSLNARDLLLYYVQEIEFVFGTGLLVLDSKLRIENFQAPDQYQIPVKCYSILKFSTRCSC